MSIQSTTLDLFLTVCFPRTQQLRATVPRGDRDIPDDHHYHLNRQCGQLHVDGDRHGTGELMDKWPRTI
jgi:hypothetical protein